ncbi:hypothetical protein FA04_27625 (plasmid) [Ensifer adhaerens]|uniref:HNH endonuclease n=1 Tax=Ensifer adhaerens TaxID=106592 RepID=A0ABY8HS57_ENSAD|nr:HNH endonuclease [Ensifer adhaerens]ANK76524.1 hypothetical protein FA04_27625 [Ensifer adhaerens]KDP74017.1 hypothetical protein FA04_08805 [Ensifer adhaerens]WFP94937.1 HNH endonuclease [Ensifer adhaerens]
MSSAAIMQPVEDRAAIMSAMTAWRNAFFAEGRVTPVGHNELCQLSSVGIWLEVGQWHRTNMPFYSVLGLIDEQGRSGDRIVEINPAQHGQPGNNRGLVGRDAEGKLWLLRSGAVQVAGGVRHLESLEPLPETLVNVQLSSGAKLYYKVACLDGAPQEIISQTKRFVEWASQLREGHSPDASTFVGRIPETAFYRLHIRPQGIDKVLEVIEDDQIAIGWSEASTLISPEVEEGEFRELIEAAYGDRVHPGKSAGEMQRFLRRMKIGDAVLVPHSTDVYVGRVLSAPEYYPDLVEHDTAFRRNVAWLNDGKPYAKSAFGEDAVASLNARTTCISLEKHRDAILDVIYSDWQALSAILDAEGADNGVDGLSYALAQARPEQINFRRRLVEMYGARCCLTGTSIAEILQAAHISPHHKGGPQVNSPKNGLLLRSDIHGLFDRKLLSIDPETMTIRLAPSIATYPEYADLHNKKVHLHACGKRLAAHHDEARLSWGSSLAE